jgi:hypothetical protein
MAKAIFDNFPPTQRAGGHKARADCGGFCVAKELPYSPPVGPKGQMQQGPGLHGTNHGNCGTQGRR